MAKTAITIQARMTSTRLPGKILLPALNRPLLELMIERLRRIEAVDKIILCTTTNETDDILADLSALWEIECFRGSEHDVMSRVLSAAKHFEIDTIIETTSDCPLIDPNICSQVIDEFHVSKSEYCSNVYERSFPIGMDVQVFSTDVLEDAFSRTEDPEEREHVSLFIYRHPEIYNLSWITAPESQKDPNLRLTLDTPEDYDLIKKLYELLYPTNPNFSLDDILQLITRIPELRKINNNINHNWVTY